MASSGAGGAGAGTVSSVVCGDGVRVGVVLLTRGLRSDFLLLRCRHRSCNGTAVPGLGS